MNTRLESFSPVDVEYTAQTSGRYPPTSPQAWTYHTHFGAEPPPTVEILDPVHFRLPPTPSGIKMKLAVRGSAAPEVNGIYRKLPRTANGKRQYEHFENATIRIKWGLTQVGAVSRGGG